MGQNITRNSTEWYDRLWAYARRNLINPKFGNWYERLSRDHDRDGPNHGPAVEPGYHPVVNCWLSLRALESDRGHCHSG